MPENLAPLVRVGTIVRVDLHGRHVRGWVTATDVEPEAATLRPIRKVSSAGPPWDLMTLCDWIAWRWSGPVAHVLRSASPPNVVAPNTPFGSSRSGPGSSVELFVRSPATDRRELVTSRFARDGSSIVVVPDAERAATFAAEMRRLGWRVAVFTSGQSDAARTSAWVTAAGGGCVVVGGRTAALAPVPDLAALVVLDDADEAVKEERVPTWSARDVALERARRTAATLAMVTPVPTVEALVEASEVHRPDRSAEWAGWARIEVLNPRDEQPGRELLGDRLLAAVRAELAEERRVVCVLNRKGRARLLVCRACGTVACCERCGAAVVEGPQAPASALHCERCGTGRPRICTDCHATVLRSRRLGVTRVREALGGLLPGVEVQELDATSDRPAIAPVVVGTEAVLHRVRPPVGLVAFLEFDQELLAARYRAAEQAMWLLVRASRLVGGRRGRVIVQTGVVDHEVLTAARRGDVLDLARAERARRETLGFPPFGGLAELSGNGDAVARAAQLLDTAGADVLGPHAGRALVRAGTPRELADMIAATDLTPARAFGRLRVEVDPLRV